MCKTSGISSALLKSTRSLLSIGIYGAKLDIYCQPNRFAVIAVIKLTANYCSIAAPLHLWAPWHSTVLL